MEASPISAAASRSVDDAAVLAHMSRNAGVQFDAPVLAEFYSVPHDAMRRALARLHERGLIKRESEVKGGRVWWSVPEHMTKLVEPAKAPPFKPLSASSLPCLDYERRRAGSADMLKVPSKFHD